MVGERFVPTTTKSVDTYRIRRCNRVYYGHDRVRNISNGGALQPGIALATTEVELAELPPPWIPVVFGLGLVVVCSIC